MPGIVDRMELRKVATEADDDSMDSLDDRFTETIDSEKATINRLRTAMQIPPKTIPVDILLKKRFVFIRRLCSQFLDDMDDGESQKFLTNGMMKKKYEEYHEEYVSTLLNWFSLSSGLR